MAFDPDGLHRAILNIVTNAIDAAASGEGRVMEDMSQESEYDELGSESNAGQASASGVMADGLGSESSRSQRVEPPRVEVGTAYLADLNRLQVQIRDNGVGIPEDQQQRIFNAFVSSKGQRGTGLGLPVSQKIMEEHGGQIGVSSETGEGSCFTLELPAIPAANVTATNFFKL